MWKRTLILAILSALLSFLAGFTTRCTFKETDKGIGKVVQQENRENAVRRDETAEPESSGVKEQEPEKRRFNGSLAYETVKMLCLEIGTRVEGTSQEKNAADRLHQLLFSYGCDRVYRQTFTLPDGKTSQNVVAVVEGKNPGYALVIGGHYDSRSTTTGGNDNASGAATVVELARVFAGRRAYPTLYFVLFGAEEDWGEITPEHENSHFGSRFFVKNMGRESERVVGMLSLDMVGFGEALHVRYMGVGPMDLVHMLRDHALRESFVVYLRKSGNLSDHEPFEKAGIPAAWLEYMLDAAGNYDRAVHTWEDDYHHVNPYNLQYVGDLVQSLLEGLGEEECARLKKARRGGS